MRGSEFQKKACHVAYGVDEVLDERQAGQLEEAIGQAIEAGQMAGTFKKHVFHGDEINPEEIPLSILRAEPTDAMTDGGERSAYFASGLLGEAAELASEVFAYDPDACGSVDEAAVEEELGDVLFYCALIADEHNLSLDQIMKNAVAKAKRRAAEREAER